jgi:pyruvate formate lyase activating enzyme
MTPQEVYEAIEVDELYFRYSRGGVTFGGGEPLLYSGFINQFHSICNHKWNIAVETSLNVPLESLMQCVEPVDSFIVDIKCISEEKYKRYTDVSNRQVLSNLSWLAKHIESHRIGVRIPEIPNVTTEADIQYAEEFVRVLGITQIDKFTYMQPSAMPNARQTFKSIGKSVCKVLKDIRCDIATSNGLRYEREECHFAGDCLGTCPKCDAELATITTYIRTLERFKSVEVSKS